MRSTVPTWENLYGNERESTVTDGYSGELYFLYKELETTRARVLGASFRHQDRDRSKAFRHGWGGKRLAWGRGATKGQRRGAPPKAPKV